MVAIANEQTARGSRHFLKIAATGWEVTKAATSASARHGYPL